MGLQIYVIILLLPSCHVLMGCCESIFHWIGIAGNGQEDHGNEILSESASLLPQDGTNGSNTVEVRSYQSIIDEAQKYSHLQN